MLATSTAKSDRQITLAFVNIVRQQIQQQTCDTVKKFLCLRKSIQVGDQLRVLSCERAEFRFEMRVGQKAHIEDEVRLERDPILIAETQRGNQQVFSTAAA